MNHSESEPKGGGLAGSLKVVAGLSILAVAVLAALFVLEVIPQSMFQTIATKILLLALVAVLATGALWFVMRIGRR